MPIADVQSTKT